MLQIVLYGTSSRLRKQALRDPKMTLQGLLVTGRQLERSNVQARHIEEDKQELQREGTNINLLKTKASRAVRRIFLPGGHTGSGALITIFRFMIA